MIEINVFFAQKDLFKMSEVDEKVGLQVTAVLTELLVSNLAFVLTYSAVLISPF